MGGGHTHAQPGAYDDRDAVKAVVVSAVALGAAAVVEAEAALVGHSAGVLADSLHNFGDVLTTAILLASFWRPRAQEPGSRGRRRALAHRRAGLGGSFPGGARELARPPARRPYRRTADHGDDPLHPGRHHPPALLPDDGCGRPRAARRDRSPR